MPMTQVFRDESVSRRSAGDALFVALSLVHLGVLLVAGSAVVIAIGLWWNANTISHNFIHRPFFRSARANHAFSLGLSLLLGFPQAYWRDRHLRHHAALSPDLKVRGSMNPMSSPDLTRGSMNLMEPRVFRPGVAAQIEATAILGLFAVMAAIAPRFFLLTYLPGWAAGLGLCWLQGHYEHERGTTSHYGRLYNFLFFNDGYHVEHHARPGVHWLDLPGSKTAEARTSAWPAVLRWIDDLRVLGLNGLERCVLRSAWLQAFVVSRHAAAVRRLLPDRDGIERITIVGGGLFPRSALVMSRLFPDAAITVIDAEEDHLQTARAFLPASVRVVNQRWDARSADAGDLVVIPLAFEGDRRRLYDAPPAPRLLVHDWIWAVRPNSVIISWLLIKRLTLVRQ